MLFDLRSPRRKNTVRIVYFFLAVIMVAGLVLVGVGTGSGGGLLNAFTNNGSGGNQNAVNDQQTKAALKQTKKHPNSAAAWASLMQARFSAAGSGSNATTNASGGLSYTSAGLSQLKLATHAWDRYVTLTGDKPSLNNSVLAARVYQSLSEWSNASSAWQYAAATQPAGSTNALSQYFCMALNAYAAKQTNKGDLASAEVTKLAPKLRRLTLKQELTTAKSSASTAQQAVLSNC